MNLHDNVEIMKLLEAHGYTEETGALVLRAQGYEIAEAILETNRATVLALADQLVERGRIEASDLLSILNGQAPLPWTKPRGCVTLMSALGDRGDNCRTRCRVLLLPPSRHKSEPFPCDP